MCRVEIRVSFLWKTGAVALGSLSSGIVVVSNSTCYLWVKHCLCLVASCCTLWLCGVGVLHLWWLGLPLRLENRRNPSLYKDETGSNKNPFMSKQWCSCAIENSSEHKFQPTFFMTPILDSALFGGDIELLVQSTNSKKKVMYENSTMWSTRSGFLFSSLRNSILFLNSCLEF